MVSGYFLPNFLKFSNVNGSLEIGEFVQKRSQFFEQLRMLPNAPL